MRDLFAVVVHTLVLRADSLLLLRRARTGYMDGWYALPGGHMQRGEAVIECATRELREETGIRVASTQLRPAAVMPYRSADQQGIDIIMVCSSFSGEPWLAEPERFDELGWWRVDALPARTVPYVAAALALMNSGAWFLEFDGQKDQV